MKPVYALYRAALVFVAISSLLLGVTFTTGCPKKEIDKNVAFAQDLVGSFEAASPLIHSKSEAAGKRWDEGTSIARKILTAAQASDSTRFAGLLKDLLPIFTDTVKQFSNDQNILLALALAQIALNFYTNHYMPVAKMAASKDDMKAIHDFRALPQFGCQLRPDRCK